MKKYLEIKFCSDMHKKIDSNLKNGSMAYWLKTGEIFIGLNEPQNFFDRNMLEECIENGLSHETVHAVLHKIEGINTCYSFDSLKENMGNAPFSNPLGIIYYTLGDFMVDSKG